MLAEYVEVRQLCAWAGMTPAAMSPLASDDRLASLIHHSNATTLEAS